MVGGIHYSPANDAHPKNKQLFLVNAVDNVSYKQCPGKEEIVDNPLLKRITRYAPVDLSPGGKTECPFFQDMKWDVKEKGHDNYSI